MASLRRAALFMLLVASADAARARKSASANSTEPRPTYGEWKDAAANTTKAAKAAAAVQAKKAAVDKVVSMLETLQQKVLGEGEKEAQTYNKFACFCKDTTAEKSEAIKTGTDKKASLSTEIGSLSAKRDGLDTTISQLLSDIEQAEKDKKSAMAARAKELAEYEKNSADLIAAIQALEGAIRTMKASKAPSLAQLQSVAKTVKRATLIADALGLGGDSAHRFAVLLQQAPDVPMEDYKFHSDNIIATLEKLLKDFGDEKNTVNAEEVKAVAAHEALLQDKETLLKQKNLELDTAKKEKAETQDRIATASQELSVAAATLLDDQEYLKELSQMCSDKAKTWDQRSRVRRDELSALTAAIGIVKGFVDGNTSAATVRFVQQGVSVRLAEAVAHSPAAMEALEAVAEEADAAAGAGAPPALLQQAQERGAARGPQALLSTQKGGQPAKESGAQQAVAELLRAQGDKLRSTLLTSLASRVAADPFAKVKKLIEELVNRLQREASSEATQKGFCDKSTADATQKRDLAASAIKDLNGRMMELEAKRDDMSQDIGTLTKEINEINQTVQDANRLRAEESAENKAAIDEASAGEEATRMAMEVLYKYYKTVDDAQVNLTLVQRGPMEDAPDAGFDIGEAYQGSQGDAGGIIGMLEVIQSDFRRTIEVTTEEEAQAEREHTAFLTESGKSLAEKTTARDEKTKYQDNAEEALASAEQDMEAETGKLQGAIKELLDLKPVCVDTTMSYEERVALREDEIASLHKALCIFENYGEYGPDGSTSC
uniref:Uncharacterized protein n=1 Tax=Alexandrium monilatum TaxID=311494 RepID=A0A7S4QWS5_9DINO